MDEVEALRTMGQAEVGSTTLEEALSLNKKLREMEGRLIGGAAGKPPLPKRAPEISKGGGLRAEVGIDGRGAEGTEGKSTASRTADTSQAHSTPSHPGSSRGGANASSSPAISKTPQRELRRPSAEKRTSAEGGQLQVARRGVGAGSTWSEWEPRRDRGRQDASFTNDDLYRIRSD